MLSNTLNTNEIKTTSGVEVEFTRITNPEAGRGTEFAQIGEAPALKHRLSIKHQESGSGIRMRRRGVVRFDKTSVSTVDSLTPVTTSAYAVLDAPIGALTTNAELIAVLTELISFLSTTGAGTTVLFDGSGNGVKALVEGSY